MVLNEPESSLHPDLLPALAQLIRWKRQMRSLIALVTFVLLAAPALADDRDVITAQMREWADAIGSGQVVSE
jgi:predicted ATPase